MGDKLTIHLLSIVNDHDDLDADHDTEQRIMPDDHGRNYNDADDYDDDDDDYDDEYEGDDDDGDDDEGGDVDDDGGDADDADDDGDVYI